MKNELFYSLVSKNFETHMKLQNIYILVSIVFFTYGCQSNSINETDFFTGESHTDPVLKKDTMKMIKTIVRAKGCGSIEHVDTKVLFYEENNETSGHIWGKEGWMVTGCSGSFPFIVTFTEDGNGGTFFGISNK